jgi:hypothetical protein
MSADRKISLAPSAPATPGTNGRPLTSNPPAAAAPSDTKKFPRETPAFRRGPGRPRKDNQERGGAPAQADASRPESQSASVPASVRKDPPPAVGADEVARGFLAAVGGAAAVTSALLLKIPLDASFECWSFSKEELGKLTPQVEELVKKYLPRVAKWGPEAELAGSLLPMLAGKVAAVIVAAKIFRATNLSPHKIPPPAVRPSKSADVVEIRPSEKTEASEAATSQTPAQAEDVSASSTAASASPLPDPFKTDLVDKNADLIGGGLN